MKEPTKSDLYLNHCLTPSLEEAEEGYVTPVDVAGSDWVNVSDKLPDLLPGKEHSPNPGPRFTRLPFVKT